MASSSCLPSDVCRHLIPLAMDELKAGRRDVLLALSVRRRRVEGDGLGGAKMLMLISFFSFSLSSSCFAALLRSSSLSYASEEGSALPRGEAHHQRKARSACVCA